MAVNIKKKIDRVSPGFDRVDRVTGRPAGFTGLTPKRVFTSTRTSPKPGSRVDAPGRSGFQNTGSGTYNYPSDQNYHYMFPLQTDNFGVV